MVHNILRYFSILGIISCIGFFIVVGEPLALALAVCFIILRAVEILTEANSNVAVIERIKQAEELLTVTHRTVDVVKDRIEDAKAKMDRDYDDRLDIFARSLNNILGNINTVSISMGYGENLKKVNKSQFKSKD